MNKIRTAVIGAGRMGITHLSIINSHPDVECVAVCDSSDLVLNVLTKYMKGLKSFSDYKKMIDDQQLDLVLICTPPQHHFEIIKYAINKNLHVFVEKPFTLYLKESRELIELIKEKKLVNQVGYVYRFNDSFIKAKKIIDSGILGELVSFKSEMFGRTVIKNDDGDGWRGSYNTGGGCLYEFGSHVIDLTNYLLGKPDEVRGSSLIKVYSKKVDDIVRTNLFYNKGLSGSIYVNWSDETYRKPSTKIEIFGKEGKLLADQHEIRIYLKKENAEHKLKKGWNTIFITDMFEPVDFYVRGNEFSRQLYHLVDCINNKNTNGISGFVHANHTQEIIDTIFNEVGLVQK